MEQTYPTPPSPRRLTERRGKPELQPLDPVLPSTMAAGATDTEIQSSDSSIPSGVYSTENYATPAMTAPATPTDASPLRTLGLPFTGSSIVGSSIQEEDEMSNCDCQACEVRCWEYGLGLAVGAVGTMGTKDVAFPRLDTVRTVREAFVEPCYGTHYHFNEKLAPVALPTMPPTPPTNSGEMSCMFSTQVSPTSPIDAEAFSCGPPSSSSSLPQSPKSEVVGNRSRAATILNKVVPAKLRASLKRRMSGANDNANQPPPLPPIITMPTYLALAGPGTPPDDALGKCFVQPLASSVRADDNFSPLSSPEAILPPTMLLSQSPRSPGIEPESYLATPLQSPRVGMPPFVRTASFPEISYSGAPNEIVASPLHPPTISPLMPSLSSASQTSLNVSGASSQHAHKKVPSIDPATPLAPRKPATPLTLVTVNSLADTIEEMRDELAAYDATLARMNTTGWSSPQEIRNVELQREDAQRNWQKHITESKKILEGMRRTEVKPSAMSSVSSFDSYASMPGSVQLMSSHVTSATSLRNNSFAGSERSVPV